ncbi:ABC transporter permease [Pueribacillus theae]|uniref:ABC transporter permease n=1 Tax=Pueribacillus theae TaxID=2171751 RepID=A0A2U1JV24_9BACI|nr:ABC transporter permease [Pueribacillus theae]PWA09061.1 ABC transporter permease [Pueribacillus theae]
MLTALFGSLESGIIYALMALGVYLSFRILDFPDLTVDGSFVTGAAVAASMLINGIHPVIATLSAIVAGFLAGCITGILHTKGKINPLLSGILMMIALYSINLRIMGRANVPLLNEETFFTQLRSFWESSAIGSVIPVFWAALIVMAMITLIIKFLVDAFLKTEIGLAIRATGDNKRMIRSLSANTDRLTILGLGLSNALVALSGAFVAQYSGFSDIGAGVGMIVIGLASVIIGEALFGTKTIVRTTFAVIGGAIIYRIVVALALRVEFLETGDMKLITAVIVIFALVMPKIIENMKEKKRRKQRQISQFESVQEDGERLA